LRLIEAEIACQLARETMPVQVALADLKPALSTALEQAFEDAPGGFPAQWLVFAPIREGTQAVGAILLYKVKHQRLSG